MKYILILLMISLTTHAAQNKPTKEQLAVQKAIEAEKKIAKEQVFHQGSNYDLKSQEVDLSSVDGLSTEEDTSNDDFDMDDAY